MVSCKKFTPALLVVDFQEDFCPPNGSLAVPSGRSIAPIINTLLSYPFTLKLATQDWHPPNHTSFYTSHPGAEPYTSNTTITHPTDPSRSYTTTLWPVHCVQDSPGAALVPELETSHLNGIVKKGMTQSVEMYSAFWDPLKVVDSGLGERLREREVTHVYVVGLAGDFCVKATAESAVEEGFTTYIVKEGTKPVFGDKWEGVMEEIERNGVKMVGMDGEEVARVKELRGQK